MCMAVLGILGSVVSAAGSIMQGNAANEAAKMQQKAYEQQAQADAQASAFESERERYKQELAAGAARAQVGASGVAMTGSPTEVLVAQAREGQLDLDAIKYGSQLRQNQLRTQGQIERFKGKQAKTAGYIGAATSIISGFSSMASRSVNMTQSPFR